MYRLSVESMRRVRCRGRHLCVRGPIWESCLQYNLSQYLLVFIFSRRSCILCACIINHYSTSNFPGMICRQSVSPSFPVPISGIRHYLLVLYECWTHCASASGMVAMGSGAKCSGFKCVGRAIVNRILELLLSIYRTLQFHTKYLDLSKKLLFLCYRE